MQRYQPLFQMVWRLSRPGSWDCGCKMEIPHLLPWHFCTSQDLRGYRTINNGCRPGFHETQFGMLVQILEDFQPT